MYGSLWSSSSLTASADFSAWTCWSLPWCWWSLCVPNVGALRCAPDGCQYWRYLGWEFPWRSRSFCICVNLGWSTRREKRKSLEPEPAKSSYECEALHRARPGARGGLSLVRAARGANAGHRRLGAQQPGWRRGSARDGERAATGLAEPEVAFGPARRAR